MKARENPDRKEIRLLLSQKLEREEDFEQFIRGKEKAYQVFVRKVHSRFILVTLKVENLTLLIPDKKGALILVAGNGVAYEVMERYTEAISLYQECLAKLPGDKELFSSGSALLRLLDRIGECNRKRSNIPA
ncbi:hypothetical protein P3T76_014427 [Phytophthora citrophthora]|uniref:Tetratricopeptide repeat protein n=1 Tax=Phytophthora citrophthora TaxID=4793 RepID=A0AAD9G192_9STRA|nr:hypothetical protein P3T76_014427 [Phytophthora citrophthora]